MTGARIKIILRGAVQGVGFRPFVYRLATEMNLAGWVLNSAQGLFIEAEGMRATLEEFLLRLEKEKPPAAVVHSLEFSFLDPRGYAHFEIRQSEESGKKTAVIMPDIATCSDCLREIFDPRNRRYLYPFTNCTNCGPRFTIIEALPYDRPNTAMKKFAMCPACREEYDDPHDRRFHAQPNACPSCGPHLELWETNGKVLTKNHDALQQSAHVVREGKILALKGIGGFLLMVDARNHDAVMHLRARKQREEKPFAVMYPSLTTIKAECHVSALEERLLQSPESPIVLLARKPAIRNLTSAIAPNNPHLGVMLPYSPLHHLLLRELGFPVVATSGNLSDEPICIDEHEALARLGAIADAFLVHDRPIVRHVDDSVARVMLGRELILRRSRGYAPLPIHLHETLPKILAVGAHLKNTIAVSVANNVFLSQHIGDLETKEAHKAFQKVIADFQRLYECTPEAVVCDLHPDYLSTQHAHALKIPVIAVQHHYAHVAACMAENELQPPALGVSWDGAGFGLDGTIWGSEFLHVKNKSFERVAHFRSFKLPGGEAAIKQPRRAALGVLYEIFGTAVFERDDLIPLESFSRSELRLLQQMLEKDLNTPVTTSAGRLFDAVAALVGLRQHTAFEGQAAMELEFAIGEACTDEIYSFSIDDLGFRNADFGMRIDDLGMRNADFGMRNDESETMNVPASTSDSRSALRNPQPAIPDPQSAIVIDWQPMILGIVEDVKCGQEVGLIAAKFHNTLVEIMIAVARAIREQKIVLSGGCFQNKYLAERAVRRLKEAGFKPYWHQRVPPNDGGIALGQVMAAARV
ncbi:carbamoyltransferase HypF [candidate division KSB1 bacterium]|nr:MAG: carbamoyltransferase HypF [candidate division KSB1 bacterium]MCE7944985.1 carbamoyltransferase HypF [Chlorobi bacterium CHB1]MDL1874966.1 carbamoyltransferase HypF [Cytophagia bacterium CHB2]